MKEHRLITKISLFFIIISGILWIGGLHCRAIVSFDLLQIGTLDFKPNIHPLVERAVFRNIAHLSGVINIAYIILWFVGIIYLRTTHLTFKENGWLLMAAILFYLFTPVEIYAMVLDVKLMYLELTGSNDLVEFRKLFIHRLGALSGVPYIALLSYYTAIFVIVFQPLKQSLRVNCT